MSSAQESNPGNQTAIMRPPAPATGRLNTKAQKKAQRQGPVQPQRQAKQAESNPAGTVGTLGSHTKA